MSFKGLALVVFWISGNNAWLDVAHGGKPGRQNNEKDFLGHLSRALDLLPVIGVRLTQI